jgi:WhiB family transcriptional regulator, redox-sensing transcriptional regulator
MATTNPDTGWSAQGACLSADPDIFFPVSSTGPATVQLRQAKIICNRCPVRAECLEFALVTRQAHGVWGGTSERERTRIWAKRRILGPAAAGRRAGS